MIDPYLLADLVNGPRRAVAVAAGRAVGTTFTTAAGLVRSAVAAGTGASPRPRREVDRLRWSEVRVRGRRVRYAAGGEGPPVLFLHGWALGSTAYKRALRRLTARGCHVVAPAMPGFGGTDSIGRRNTSVEAYAAWVEAFTTAIGLEQPALVVGHSFGGGVATLYAHRWPERVHYLVLLNAVGGGGAVHGSGDSERPPWEWAAGFVRDFLPLDEGLDVLAAMSEDLVANLVRDPVTLYRAGQVARSADLGRELATLGDKGVPVLALSTERDAVVPDTAFAALCHSLGSDGQVIGGGHSWLLADPDRFGDVMASLVEVSVDQHLTATAETTAAAVDELLEPSGMAAADRYELLADAPPLWLMSAAPVVLAADLALCHPRLGPDEVRAVARPTADGSYRLTVVTHDRPGLLADDLAVLAERGLSVVHASAVTWPRSGLALHAVTIEAAGSMGEAEWDELGTRLRTLTAGLVADPEFRPAGDAVVEVNGTEGGRSVVTVTARDRIGLLWAACRFLTDCGANIESVHATTDSGVASDSFVVAGPVDAPAMARRLSASARV